MTKEIYGDLILEEDYTINDNLIVHGDIYGKDGNRYNLNCWDLKCFDLNCRNLNCLNLNCWNLNCWNLKCRKLKCRNLNCWDLNCRNLNCGDLNCKGNISYFAVCFAYNNIICKSIAGRRENCKHFVLDGKIIVDGVELK